MGGRGRIEAQPARARRGNVTPQEERIYIIQLCSGERRCWCFLRLDARGLAWWRDEETGRTFSEASLMYAWEIVAEA